MDDLIKRLQEEAGLTEEQALKAVTIVKDFMDDEGVKIDWDQFFKGKYEKYKKKSISFLHHMVNKIDDFSDDVNDKFEDITIQTKRKARDLSKKVYDKLNDEE